MSLYDEVLKSKTKQKRYLHRKWQVIDQITCRVLKQSGGVKLRFERV